mmetsp:Transcript_45697/g.74536  ORF Transcript_45697/g.74536 Transcript_45697/m.74536 type:complete len:338 (+) Transcript_45697:542-1555(+)
MTWQRKEWLSAYYILLVASLCSYMYSFWMSRKSSRWQRFVLSCLAVGFIVSAVFHGFVDSIRFSSPFYAFANFIILFLLILVSLVSSILVLLASTWRPFQSVQVNTAVIQTATNQGTSGLSSITTVKPQRVKTLGRDQGKYFCPVCFLYYDSVYKTKCCSNYICEDCALSFIKGKGALPESAEEVPSGPIPSIECPYCTAFDLHCILVQPGEQTRRYEDSPMITSQMKPSRAPLASPLKIGDSFEALKAKLITFEQAGIKIARTPSSLPPPLSLSGSAITDASIREPSEDSESAPMSSLLSRRFGIQQSRVTPLDVLASSSSNAHTSPRLSTVQEEG